MLTATRVTFDAFRLQLSLLFVPTFEYPLPRRERHYDLRLPLSVSLHSDVPGEITVVSGNISSHGILLSSKAAIPEGTSIKLMQFLPNLFGERVPGGSMGDTTTMEWRIGWGAGNFGESGHFLRENVLAGCCPVIRCLSGFPTTLMAAPL